MGSCYRNHVSTNANKAVVQTLLRCKRSDFVDWDALREFLRCHPIATEENTRSSTEDDPMGRVLLVEIVSRDPPVDVVDEALRVFPDSLTLNVSSFFAACQSASSDVIRILARHVTQKKKKGDLDIACPYPWIVFSLVPARGARVLLEEYPQGALQVMPSNRFSSNACPLDHMLFPASGSTKSRKPDPQWWEKLKLMLMVEEYGTVKIQNERSLRPVHAILRRIMNRPQFFKDRKEVQHILWLLHQLQVTEPHLFQERDRKGNFPLHAILRGKYVGPCFEAARELIIMLVQAHPASARIGTIEGRLPIHLALENGWPCHDVLLEAAPEALQVRDMKTGLYPFQTAACSNTSWGENRKRSRKASQATALDITYTLLREDPIQARGLMEGGTLHVG